MENTSNKIGITGWWFASNYGSVATYYALYRTIEDMGYRPFLIDCPIEKRNEGEPKVFSREFMESRLDISHIYKWEDIYKVNDECDTFMVGSDQVWTPGSIKTMRGYFFFLDFIKDEKKKLAYGISYGQDDFTCSDEVMDKCRYYVSKFDAVSVREDVGVKICKDNFGIDVQQVLDPVFLLNKKEYDKIAQESHKKHSEKYVLAYILDPTEDKNNLITSVVERLGLKLVIIPDGRTGTFEANERKINMPGLEKDISQEDWIYYIKNAEYVLTDSHHGAALAIIYKKPFICYANYSRGQSRFTSLFNKLNLMERMVFSASEVDEKNLLDKEIDYKEVHSILDKEKKIAIKWLSDALKKEKHGATIPVHKTEESIFKEDKDFARCKMLVSLIRDYGIKHIVLSSGTRNMNLVRLFEGNDCFRTYNVVDERSAAFYAIGISLKLNEPVAICCTSGTAASNYLSGITEAFYQHVPLVVITADRYPCLLGQMEDQTIPQNGMYGDVCKKSVSLPVNVDFLSDWETRRLICEALLEVRNNGDGPVHINVPINTIDKRMPSEKDLRLINGLRRIMRVDTSSEKDIWKIYCERIKEFKKILIVYGQKAPLQRATRKKLESFLDKYNCVLIRDHLSNIHDVGIMSFPILKTMSQEEFNENLSPDLIITFGGMRMLNDPITYRLRWAREPIEHWHVAEDGKIADRFRKLTTVFHCGIEQFLERFLKESGLCSNDKKYLNCWEQLAEEKKEANIEQYGQKYTLQELTKQIPDKSLVHIGIGNTIMYSNLFPIKKNIEVFCNMGTNGIDGSASTFMGHVAVTDQLAYLLIGDLSFFYDLNSVFNKELKPNIRIFLSNNDGAGLLRDIGSPAITHEHHKIAKAYVEALGFEYIYASSKEMFHKNLKIFTDKNIKKPIFFEVFT